MKKIVNNITFGISIYNCDSRIERLISNIKNQSVVPKEVIFVDDCSSDNSVITIEKEINKTRINYK